MAVLQRREKAAGRRRFLELCGRFAAGMPPAIGLLLSASDASADHDQSDDHGHTCALTPSNPHCFDDDDDDDNDEDDD